MDFEEEEVENASQSSQGEDTSQSSPDRREVYGQGLLRDIEAARPKALAAAYRSGSITLRDIVDAARLSSPHPLAVPTVDFDLDEEEFVEMSNDEADAWTQLQTIFNQRLQAELDQAAEDAEQRAREEEAAQRARELTAQREREEEAARAVQREREREEAERRAIEQR